jgi:hypothetical protein
VADWPRQSTIVSATNASIEKNAQVITPRSRIAAGRTGLAIRVPGGVSPRSANVPITTPPMPRTSAAMGRPLVRPRVSSPAPSATATASGSRARLATAADVLVDPGRDDTWRNARRVTAPDRPMSGRRPRKTNRQPIDSPTAPAMAGPMTPGRIQAVDSVANIRGRTLSGSERPIAT